MNEPSIQERVAELRLEVSKHKDINPRFALLCCRMIAESILLEKHITMVKNGEIKNRISIGEMKNLGLDKEFDSLQQSSFEFIRNSTGPLLHFNYEEPKLPSNLVDRVLTELDYLQDLPDESRQISEPSITEFDMIDWKNEMELEIVEWMSSNERLLTRAGLRIDRANYNKGVASSKNPRKTNAFEYVNGINELLGLDDEELLSREKLLIKKILIIFYSRYGGPDFVKKAAVISSKDLRSVMRDANCLCGPNAIVGSLLSHGHLKKNVGTLRLKNNWKFMLLK